MLNMRDPKTKKIISTIIVVVLVLNFLAKWISKRFDVNKID